MAQETEVEQLRRLLDESFRKNQDLENRTQVLKSRNQNLKKVNWNLQTEHQNLQNDHQSLQTEHQHLKKENQHLKKENQLLHEETRATTLEEFIEAYHTDVFSTFSVQQNQSLTSRGSVTNPGGKLIPTTLEPWTQFFDDNKPHFDDLFLNFPPNDRLFQSRHSLSGLGSIISAPIANEKMLEVFMRLAVEDPVRRIIEKAAQDNMLGPQSGIGLGVVFENHSSAISDVALQEDNRDDAPPPQTPPRSTFSEKLRPDQICVYRKVNGTGTMEERNLLLIEEYKAPHKLTTDHLRASLQGGVAMNIHAEFVNNPKIPTKEDPDAYFEYHARRLTAAAISQTYNYMIEGGVSYGILTNGEATVFLKADWDDKNPGRLLYHLAEPKHEVAHHSEEIFCWTAIGQYLSFTLLALSQQHQVVLNQDERNSVKGKLKTWVYDYEEIVRSMSPEDSPPPDKDTTYKGKIYKPKTHKQVNRSPFLLRWPRREQGGEPGNEPARRRTPQTSEDEPRETAPDSPSPAERRERSRGRGSRGRGTRGRQTTNVQSRGAASSSNSTRGEQYCTQKCLIGLVNGDYLDMRCPNVSRHKGIGPASCGVKTKAHHPVNHATWLQLLREQWKTSLDDGITSLHINGASGALFRVTLLRYGYTFIGKGTPAPLIKYLEHEAAVYKRLKEMQGVSVPVFLGTVDLRPMDKIYYYDHRVYIVHVTFFSWGGRTLSSLELSGGLEKRVKDGACRSFRAMHTNGVLHNDIREPNMLYNPDTKRIMIIDFDRASIVEPSGHGHGHSRTRPALDDSTKRKQKLVDAACWREIRQAKWVLSSVEGCTVK